ncbi:MAG: hypothetical protein Fur0026_13450 [Sideroxydans sp.]
MLLETVVCPLLFLLFVGRRIVSLPLFPRMSEADVERVVAAVREVLAA